MFIPPAIVSYLLPLLLQLTDILSWRQNQVVHRVPNRFGTLECSKGLQQLVNSRERLRCQKKPLTSSFLQPIAANSRELDPGIAFLMRLKEITRCASATLKLGILWKILGGKICTGRSFRIMMEFEVAIVVRRHASQRDTSPTSQQYASLKRVGILLWIHPIYYPATR